MALAPATIPAMNTLPALVPHRNFVRQLDLASLDLFVLICQTGSIGAAAEQGQLAISSVSKRIKELESALRTPLLIRHARGVVPTPAGECLLRHAQALLLGVERLRSELDEYAQGMSGHVTVYASASVLEQFLSTEVAAFAKRNPEISVDLSQRTSHEVLHAVRGGQADLGFADARDDAVDLEARPYRQERLVLVVPKQHPLAGLGAVSFAQALDYDLVGLRGSSTIQRQLEQAASEAGRVIRQRIKVASLSALCRMVESGLGVGVMPHGVLRELSRRGQLHAVALTDAWAVRELQIYAKRFDALSPPALRFLRHCTAPADNASGALGE